MFNDPCHREAGHPRMTGRLHGEWTTDGTRMVRQEIQYDSLDDAMQRDTEKTFVCEAVQRYAHRGKGATAAVLGGRAHCRQMRPSPGGRADGALRQRRTRPGVPASPHLA